MSGTPNPTRNDGVVDLIARVANSGIQYSPDEVKRELFYSMMNVDGVNDFADLNGEKIYILRGAHGIGKTALIHQFGVANDMEVFAFNMGGTVQEDLHGIPDVKTLADGTKITGHAAAELAPPFFRKPNSKSGRGIWLMDEIFSGSSMDHQNFVRAVAGRKCDEMKMFDGWFVIGTTNPNTNDYSAVRKIDASTADRFIIFNVYSNAELKLTYWRDQMNSLVFKFLLLTNIRKLSYVDATSARNWWNVSVEVYKRYKAGASVSSIEHMIASHISLPIAQDFATYLSHGDDPIFYPIATHEILTADAVQFKRLQDRLDHWISKSEIAMIGATKWDLAAFMREDLVKRSIVLDERGVKNVAALMIQLGTKGHMDMVDDLFSACRSSVHQGDWLNLTRNSPMRSEQLRCYRAYDEEKKKSN